jgi:hypothetical protein
MDVRRQNPPASNARSGKQQPLQQRLIALVHQHGALRPRDAKQHGIPREYLLRLLRKGVLERTGRGLYRIADAPVTEFHSLAEVAKRVPHAAIRLLSALVFHEMTTQNPAQVWAKGDHRRNSPCGRDLPCGEGDAAISGIVVVNLPASIRVRLLNAGRQSGADSRALPTRYAIERFLFRLGEGAQRDKLVLKGAMVFVAWEGSLHRPAKDLDLPGFGPPSLDDVSGCGGGALRTLARQGHGATSPQAA